MLLTDILQCGLYHEPSEKVSLALLMMARKELLTLDFEATMKYFRVNIPR
jgi:hypothetical protein